jgi:membrane dipeptidase
MKISILIISLITVLTVVILSSTKSSFEKAVNKEISKDTIKNPNQNTDIFSPITKFSDVKTDYAKIHFDAVVLDSHNDFLYQVFARGADLGIRNPKTQSDIPKFREGGINVQFFAIWIPEEEMDKSYDYVMNQVNTLKEFEQKYSDKFEIASTYDDIKRIVLAKKLCGVPAIEGGTAVEKVDDIKTFFDLGIRYISLTWNNSNKIGSSAADESKKKIKGGLTSFGIQVIQKMNEVGIMIDVSHLGEKSFWDVIKYSKGPIIASHSDCTALNPHYRNLTDEQIQAIAKTGGVVMVNFHNDFSKAKIKTNTLYDLYSNALDSLTELYGGDPLTLFIEKQKFLYGKKVKGGVSVDAIIDNIDYIKNLVGIDCVGIGSDMDGGINSPYDVYDVTCYPLITQKLAERGYTEPEIRKVLGLNFLRVFKVVCG